MRILEGKLDDEEKKKKKHALTKRHLSKGRQNTRLFQGPRAALPGDLC